MIPFPNISSYGIVLIGAVIILILSAPENGRIQNKEIISFITGVFIVIGISVYIDSSCSMRAVIYTLMPGSYLSYIYSFKDLNLKKKTFVFCLVTASLSFGANIFISIYMILNSGEQPSSGILQLVPMYIYCILVLYCFYIRRKSAVHLIRTCYDKSFWNNAWLVPFIIAAINIYMTIDVEKKPTRYLNPYRAIAAETILFTLLCLYMEHSYRHAEDKVKLDQAANLTVQLQMETEYYKNNLSYVQDSSRIRHDFKQIMITMQTLLADQKYDELNTFMDQYFKDNPLPESTVKYTHSIPLNAVLNHYHSNALNSQIKLNWKINIPESIQISETDLCIVFGNLLSNALKGCMTVPEEKRYINLNAEEDENGHLYITQVNSYDGNTRMKNSRFLSTTNGSGIGLGSIQQTAEKYNGMAEFKAGNTEFISNVMLGNTAPLSDTKH